MPITRSQGRVDISLEEEIAQIRREVEGELADSSEGGSSFEEVSSSSEEGSETSEEEEVVSPTVMANVQQRARFQYKTFHGKPKEDPDEWIEDFAGTAQANGEDAIKLTTLAGVLKGEARPWYNALPQATKIDWDAFKAAFVQEF